MVKLDDIERLYKSKFRKVNDFDVLFKKGRISVLYGTSGLGKTTIALYISILSSVGRDIFKGLIKVNNPKKVLYVSMELEKEDILSKFYPIMKCYKINKANVDVYDYLDIEEIDKIKNYMVEYDLIIVDSFMAIYEGKSINDVIEVKNYLMDLKKMAKYSDSHILFIHHTNKSIGKDKEYDTYLGASSIKNQTTPFIKVGKDKGTYIEIEKTNFAVPFKKLYYYINKDGAIKWYVNNNQYLNKYEDLLNIIKSENEIYVKDLIIKSGLKERTVYKYLSELEEMEIIKWERKYSERAFVKIVKEV